MNSVIIFARTKHGADRVTRDLERDGFNAAVIHGNKSQNARQKALNGFRDGSVRILVATDIAARGIDVPGISHVVNFDLPDEAESYVHRIGRTGRNGANGVAITLCDPSEASKLRQVERVIRMKLPITADHLGLPDPQREAHERADPSREPANDRGEPREARRPQGQKRRGNGFGSKPFAGRPEGAKPEAASSSAKSVVVSARASRPREPRSSGLGRTSMRGWSNCLVDRCRAKALGGAKHSLKWRAHR